MQQKTCVLGECSLGSAVLITAETNSLHGSLEDGLCKYWKKKIIFLKTEMRPAAST